MLIESTADAAPKEDTKMRKLILAAVALSGAATFSAAGTASAIQKTEHFAMVTTSTAASNPDYNVIATGAFDDYGTATHGPNGELNLTLSRGTVTLHGTKHHPRVTKLQTSSFCMQAASRVITYTVAQGTGAYKGISGSGRLTDNDTFLEPVVQGGCSPTFAAAQGFMNASGQVSLP
jgi:hypothetical protein